VGDIAGARRARRAERRAPSGDLHALVRFEADRARQWFHRGMALAPLLDRRSAACVLAMAGIYRRLLDRIEADPERALRERASRCRCARRRGWRRAGCSAGAADVGARGPAGA
jgi:phytoene synthase